MQVYIAGPMRDHPGCNFAAFDEAAARWRAAGHTVVNPAELDRAIGFDGTGPIPPGFVAGAMARDLPKICECDALAVLPGWEKSRGCWAEVYVARALDHPRAIYDAETMDRILWSGGTYLG
jgi:hypothetical protein